jgi:hypothetical protein
MKNHVRSLLSISLPFLYRPYHFAVEPRNGAQVKPNRNGQHYAGYHFAASSAIGV